MRLPIKKKPSWNPSQKSQAEEDQPCETQKAFPSPDSRIEFGTNWRVEIEKAINEATVLWSPKIF
jgi:hypothetical protein